MCVCIERDRVQAENDNDAMHSRAKCITRPALRCLPSLSFLTPLAKCRLIELELGLGPQERDWVTRSA